jgi:hypothetical protein
MQDIAEGFLDGLDALHMDPVPLLKGPDMGVEFGRDRRVAEISRAIAGLVIGGAKLLP